MSHLRHERDFYQGQCNDLGGKVLRLQRDINLVRTALKRSQMATSLILGTYRLIQDEVTMEDIGRRFLQEVLGILWLDRAIILHRDGEQGYVPRYWLGLDRPGTDRLDPGGEAPEFLSVTSGTEPDSLYDLFRGIIGSPYFQWVCDRRAGVALLLGNCSEDRVFRLPFSNDDRCTVESALSVYVDISERKEAKRALEESEGRYRRLVQSSPEAIFLCAEGLVTFANQAGLRLLGAESPGAIIGRPLLEFVYPPDRPAMQSLLKYRTDLEQVPPPVEKRFRRLDGRIMDAEVVAIPFAAQDRDAAVQIVALDVSERRKMEAELLRVEKIESLGVLAGGIAHDFNNILTGILGNIDLAKIYMDPGQKAYHFLEDAETASRRAQDLTQKLLTFSKGGAPLRKTALLSEIISESVSFILSGSRVRFEYDQPEDLRSANIDVVQFRQVIDNLTVNASQAMPEGGIFRITAENAGESEIRALSLPERLYIRLTISDSGNGIPRENLPKIFDPYFTTKEKGSGLGLATAHSIVSRHGGHISVESEPGGGTTFHVYIPASDEAPVAGEGYPGGPTPGMGRVLVMDDEELVREVAVKMLQRLGFGTAAASAGQEALDLYLSAMRSGSPFDAVIMDLTIPGGMGGQELAARLLEIDPGMRAIVASGYSNDPILAECRTYGFRGIIAKPFSLAELSETLRRVLEEPRL